MGFFVEKRTFSPNHPVNNLRGVVLDFLTIVTTWNRAYIEHKTKWVIRN